MNNQQNKSLTYQIYHYPFWIPLLKYQSDIFSNQEVQRLQDASQQNQSQTALHQYIKKIQKRTYQYWTLVDRRTYSLYKFPQNISLITSPRMKNTLKIFKQMSKLIGTRTQSQLLSLKFTSQAQRGENGKRRQEQKTKTELEGKGRKVFNISS